MRSHVSASPDISLAFKQGWFGGLSRMAAAPPAEAMAARFMAPDCPDLALALGESLVRTPSRVLAFTAHPDDLEFFAGGVLRRMALAGSRITAVVLTDGEKRGNWTSTAAQRQLEQREAVRLQGYHDVQFLGLPDFGLPEDPRVEHLVARAWDQVSPEVLFAFSPKELMPHVANRDHKALGRTVMDLARARLHTRAQVYFYGTYHPDVLVDISTVMADKLKAVKTHRSQMVYLDDAETDGVIRLMGRIAAGKARCTYAEPLYRLI